MTVSWGDFAGSATSSSAFSQRNCTPLSCANAPIQTLKRNDTRCSRPPSVVVDDSRKMRSDLRLCADPAVGHGWRRTVSAGLLADCLRTEAARPTPRNDVPA